MTLELAWRDWREFQSAPALEKLIETYRWLVLFAISKIDIPYSAVFEFEDAFSCGLLGLLEAIDKFDPSRGFKFETYALHRIRGAILDGLRQVQWQPRSIQKKHSWLEQTVVQFEANLGRLPTKNELVKALGLSWPRLQGLLDEVNDITVLSLDDIVVGDGHIEDIVVEETIADLDGDPSTILEQKERRRLVRVAVAELPERERMVVVLRLWGELHLKSIGEILGVNESRICQILHQAYGRLR